MSVFDRLNRMKQEREIRMLHNELSDRVECLRIRYFEPSKRQNQSSDTYVSFSTGLFKWKVNNDFTKGDICFSSPEHEQTQSLLDFSFTRGEYLFHAKTDSISSEIDLLKVLNKSFHSIEGFDSEYIEFLNVKKSEKNKDRQIDFDL